MKKDNSLITLQYSKKEVKELLNNLQKECGELFNEILTSESSKNYFLNYSKRIKQRAQSMFPDSRFSKVRNNKNEPHAVDNLEIVPKAKKQNSNNNTLSYVIRINKNVYSDMSKVRGRYVAISGNKKTRLGKIKLKYSNPQAKSNPLRKAKNQIWGSNIKGINRYINEFLIPEWNRKRSK
ncbi:hypothetical protein [Mycoplasmopsis felis]|uniref:hypothetical protein n=1 Tax=Mycoplasmopsis felis TaxID=33923 RepID=UPI002AFEB291|nr:hypothetical protein [Mycoplasmopsis felis]WQQ10443.1 hypothetical protein RRG49_01760 [Mycoplasmopsis felis]